MKKVFRFLWVLLQIVVGLIVAALYCLLGAVVVSLYVLFYEKLYINLLKKAS